MADLFLRSNIDKGESSDPTNLRLGSENDRPWIIAGGLIKVMIAGEWTEKVIKVYLNSNWIEKSLKRFDGEQWVLT